MSADLFAAFGNSEEAADGSKGDRSEDRWQPWPTQSNRNLSRRQAVDNGSDLWQEEGRCNNVLFDADELGADQSSRQDVEDDFGDFENVGADGASATGPAFGFASDAGEATGNLLDLDDSDFKNANTTDKPNPASVNTVKGHPATGCALIGQENLEQSTDWVDDNDDWGTFEGVEDAPIVSPKIISLEASLDVSTSHLATGRSKAAVKAQPGEQDAQGSAVIPHTTTTTEDESDAWDDFEDGVLAVQAPVESRARVGKEVPAAQTTLIQPIPRERPTNVPPPVVLLSLFTKIWSLLASEARQPQNVEDVGMTALRTYRVSARIISGRAQRWKRDTILAQSMKIGAAGRSGGMKLTALDKGESRKEDQEAEEAASSWARVSHILHSAMVKAKVQKPPVSLSTKLVFRTATGPDVINANHVCPICGLRRNQRVNGIDNDVSDTFGEFWIEFWGHRDCYVWWEQYHQLLEQR